MASMHQHHAVAAGEPSRITTLDATFAPDVLVQCAVQAIADLLADR